MTSAATTNRAREIFHDAVERLQPDQWPAFLDSACQGDDALRRQVERLLAAHSQLSGFMGQPAAGPAATIDQPAERIGALIGPYKLLEQIGEGGMGLVYMAEQQRPVRRLVALKIIKPGMDSKQVIARFEAERQALALMDHPNIARVLDAGTTDTGRPYFIMELVRGIQINQLCDEKRLTVRQRLELFIQVCQAVQHAHQKGIIHRDLKPTNVLVTMHDAEAVPKVIDFGIAKALGAQLTEHTLHTGYSQLVGTPLYMSPEQAEMNQLGVDTRSDVYSLGVMLYELLTGSTPFDKETLTKAGFDEMRRIIREHEPERPSARLSTLQAQALSTVSERRSTDPRSITTVLRGELDWIVMKSLEKVRNFRYESASSLAADIQRYINDEPVQACPPSATYRFRKFASRNRNAVTSAGVILFCIVAGFVGTTVGLIDARRQRDAAESARQHAVAAQLAEAEQRRIAEFNEQKALASAAAERKAKEMTQQREQETAAVLNFVEDKVLAAARPMGESGGLGWNVTLRQTMKSALPDLDQAFHEQPLIEARLRQTIGTSFWWLGEIDAALQQLVRARELYTKHLGADHPRTLALLNSLVLSLPVGRKAEAVQVGEQALELRRRVLGPDHPETLEGMHLLAHHYAMVGRLTDALKLAEETLERRKATLGPDHFTTLNTMAVLAEIYVNIGRHQQGIQLHEETLALQQAKVGIDNIQTLWNMSRLADAYTKEGRHSDAIKLHEKVLAVRKQKQGPENPQTVDTVNALATSYHAIGRYADVIALREQILAYRQANLGSDHRLTLTSIDNLARELALCPDPMYRDPARALTLATSAVERLPQSFLAWNTLATAHWSAGDWTATLAAFERAKEINGGSDYAWLIAAMAHRQLGDESQAREAYSNAMDRIKKTQHKPWDLQCVLAACEVLLQIKSTTTPVHN